MGLSDLVEDEKRAVEGGTTSNQPTGDYPRVRVKGDLSNLEPISCSSCDTGTSVPVKGLDEFGSVYRCNRVFCENSIFSWDGDMGDGYLPDVHGEITDSTKSGWLW